MAFQHLGRFSSEHHGVIWISVSTASRSKIAICALYRSGSAAGTDTELIKYLDTHLDEARSNGDYVILAVDFNVHNAAWLGSTKTTSAGEAAEELMAWSNMSTSPHVDITVDRVMSDFGEPVQVKCHAPLGSSSDRAVLTSLRHHGDINRIKKKEEETNESSDRYMIRNIRRRDSTFGRSER